MKNFDYYQPTKIHFGWSRLNEIGKNVSLLGKRCLLVTVKGGPLEEVFRRIKGYLNDEGVEVFHFNKVIPNPTTNIVNQGAQMAVKNNVDVVLGVGGGSSMDTAKAISVGATHEGEAWDYRLFSDKKITEKRLPILAVPTTSGTGSQVTPVSVVTNADKKSKFAIVDPLLFPIISLIDPELMITVPFHITASTGFDVFAHSFESYIHSDASTYTDLLAEEAMKIVIEYLPKVLENGKDRESREKMAWADTLAGLCIANAGTTLPHGIAMAIGGHAPNVMHGEALAAIYPEFVEYTYPHAMDKFARIATFFNSDLKNKTKEEAAKAFKDEITTFLKQIGMYFTLSELGVPEDELSLIADDSVELPDYKANPRAATRDEIYRMLKNIF